MRQPSRLRELALRGLLGTLHVAVAVALGVAWFAGANELLARYATACGDPIDPGGGVLLWFFGIALGLGCTLGCWIAIRVLVNAVRAGVATFLVTCSVVVLVAGLVTWGYLAMASWFMEYSLTVNVRINCGGVHPWWPQWIPLPGMRA